MALTPRSDLRRRPILLLEKHLISESSHERTDRGWRFGHEAPPLKDVTEEGADYEEGKEEVGRQGGRRKESVVGVPVEPLEKIE